MRLVMQDALRLSRHDKDLDGFRDYQGAHDNLAFFYTDAQMGLSLHAGAQSPQYFKRLSALIDLPAGFRRWMGTR
jgi:hypothetical protein